MQSALRLLKTPLWPMSVNVPPVWHNSRKLRGSNSITECWSCCGKEERLPRVTETVESLIYSLHSGKSQTLLCTYSQTDAAMAVFCSEMVVREVRDMVASGKHIFGFQDVLLQRTAVLNICHDYNGYEGT